METTLTSNLPPSLAPFEAQMSHDQYQAHDENLSKPPQGSLRVLSTLLTELSSETAEMTCVFLPTCTKFSSGG